MTNCSCILSEVPRWLSSKEFTCNAVDMVQSLNREDPLEKEMATRSSILAWEIPRTEEPKRLVYGVPKESHDSETKLLSPPLKVKAQSIITTPYKINV